MLPDYLFVKTCDLESIQNVVSSESRGLTTLSRTLPGHRWELRMRVEVAPFNVRPARAFLFSLQRDNITTTYSDPDWESEVGVRTVGDDVDAGESTIPLSSDIDVELGMFLNFAGHAKLYMVESVGGGNMTIFPELHEGVALNEEINFDTPSVECELPPELKRSAQFSSTLPRELSSFSLRLMEVKR